MPEYKWLLAPKSADISFAIRCCLSIAIALWLAFWLQLDQAYWAMINAGLLLQPLAGAMVVKSFARVAGTVVAATVLLWFIDLFGQSYFLFSGAMVLWVGLMVFCASLFRNNLSYGFVLAGYVVVIIAVEAKPAPDEAFSFAIARTAETALAVVVISVVSVLIAPGATARKYENDRTGVIRALGRHLTRLISRADATGPDPATVPDELHGLLGQTLALEQSRRYARYDHPEFVTRDRLARRLDHELLTVISSLTALHVYLRRRASAQAAPALGELRELAEHLADDPFDTAVMRRILWRTRRRLLARARGLRAGRRATLADWVFVSRALELTNRLKATLIRHDMLLDDREQRVDRAPWHGRARFAPSYLLRHSLLIAVRAMLCLGVGTALWATHEDPILIGMMILLAVVTTLFSLMPNPIKAAWDWGVGGIYAGIAGFILNFLILPQAYSYATLMLALMPCVFVAGLAMANPRYGLIGRGFLVTLALLIRPSNTGLEPFSEFASSFIGNELGVGLAILSFLLIPPLGTKTLLRARMAGLFSDLARGFRTSRDRFETRLYDRLLALPSQSGSPDEKRDARRAAFALLMIGLNGRTLAVRAQRTGFSSALDNDVGSQLDATTQVFAGREPHASSIIERRDALETLALRMHRETQAFEQPIRRGHGIQSAVAAELMAVGLEHYHENWAETSLVSYSA